MPKPRYKTTNWKKYDKALMNRGSLTFWIDEEAISEWKQSKRSRPRQFSDLAITTADGKTCFLYAIESAARLFRFRI